MKSNKLKVEYTHKGWFLFCPIWIANWQSDCPDVTPRYHLQPLLWLAMLFFELMAWAYELKYQEPMPFCLKIYQQPLRKKVVRYF